MKLIHRLLSPLGLAFLAAVFTLAICAGLFLAGIDGQVVLIAGLLALLVIVVVLLVHFLVSQGPAIAAKSASGDPKSFAASLRTAIHGMRSWTDIERSTAMRKPWYLLIGPPGAGKSSVMGACGAETRYHLNQKDTGKGGTLSMDYWRFNEGVVLDTAGKLCTDPAHESDWIDFLKAIGECKGTNPISGVIIAIPTEAALSSEAKRIELADVLRERVKAVRTEFGTFVPAYVVVTKLDRIPGFGDIFGNTTRAQDYRDKILGWSAPRETTRHLDVQSISAGLETVRQQVHALADAALDRITYSESQAKTSTHLCQAAPPAAFGQVFDDLILAMNTFARRLVRPDDPLPDEVLLRGVYFSSSNQIEQTSAPIGWIGIPDGIPSSAERESTVGSLTQNAGPSPYFLKELFSKKIFLEKSLATASIDPTSFARHRWVPRAAWLTAAVAACLAFLVTSVWALRGGFGFPSVSMTRVTNADYKAMYRVGVSADGNTLVGLVQMPADPAGSTTTVARTDALRHLVAWNTSAPDAPSTLAQVPLGEDLRSSATDLPHYLPSLLQRAGFAQGHAAGVPGALGPVDLPFPHLPSAQYTAVNRSRSAMSSRTLGPVSVSALHLRGKPEYQLDLAGPSTILALSDAPLIAVGFANTDSEMRAAIWKVPSAPLELPLPALAAFSKPASVANALELTPSDKPFSTVVDCSSDGRVLIGLMSVAPAADKTKAMPLGLLWIDGHNRSDLFFQPGPAPIRFLPFALSADGRIAVGCTDAGDGSPAAAIAWIDPAQHADSPEYVQVYNLQAIAAPEATRSSSRRSGPVPPQQTINQLLFATDISPDGTKIACVAKVSDGRLAPFLVRLPRFVHP